MKKSLFLGLALVSTLGLSAQYKVSQAPVRNFAKVQSVKAINKAEVKQLNAQSEMREKQSATLQEYGLQLPVLKREKMEWKATTSDELLSGTMYMNVTSIMDGSTYSWTVDVRKDTLDANKYWFDGISGYAGMAEVYAMLSNDTLTFKTQQLAQVTEENVTQTYNFQGFQITDGTSISKVDEVKAIVDLDEETITFETVFGIYCPEIGDSYMLLLGILDAYSDAALYSAQAFPVSAAYLHPQGMLYYTFSQDGYGLINASGQSILTAVGAPDATWAWRPLGLYPEGTTFKWDYEQMQEDGTMTPLSSDEENLVIDAALNDVYTIPQLSVTSVGGETFTYAEGNLVTDNPDWERLDNNFEATMLQAGGASIVMSSAKGDQVFNLSNINPDCGLISWVVDDQGTYLFGTGGYSDDLYAYYEDPVAPLQFEGVNVGCVITSLPENTPLRLTVRDVQVEGNNLYIGDTIAYSDTWSRYDGYLHFLQFRDFKATDEDGFVSTLDYVAPERGFMLELSGYNVEGVKFVVMAEMIERPDGANYAFIGSYDEETQEYSINSRGVNTMYFSLHGVVYADLGQTGIASVESSNTTKLFSTSDAFNFTYTDDFTSVDVYNVNGQKVSTYALPQTGTFSIAKAGLADGVYMFRMNGKTTEVLRAVK